MVKWYLLILILVILAGCAKKEAVTSFKDISDNPSDYAMSNITIYGRVSYDWTNNNSVYKSQARFVDSDGYFVNVVSKKHVFKVGKYYTVTGTYGKDYTVDKNWLLVEK